MSEHASAPDGSWLGRQQEGHPQKIIMDVASEGDGERHRGTLDDDGAGKRVVTGTDGLPYDHPVGRRTMKLFSQHLWNLLAGVPDKAMPHLWKLPAGLLARRSLLSWEL